MPLRSFISAALTVSLALFAMPSYADHVPEHESVARGGIKALDEKLYDLQQQLNNIQLTPGPQGPQGPEGPAGLALTCVQEGDLAVFSGGEWVCESDLSPIITVPDSLNVGDQYRLVFITLDKTQATSADINTYNAFVTAQANSSPWLAALGTTWTIIGSTQAVDATTNTSTDPSDVGVPLFRLDGAIVANNYDDLWDGSIQNPIFVAQEGTVLDTCCGSWTGTLTNGLSAGVNALGASTGVVDGAPFAVGSNWVQTSPFGSSNLQYVYGISGVLTVGPTP